MTAESSPTPIPVDASDLLVQGIASLERVTAQAGALEKAVDELRREVQGHHSFVRSLAPEHAGLLRQLAEEVRRCQDRMDRAHEEEREARRGRWATLAAGARALWSSPDFRLLLLIAFATWLGVQAEILRLPNLAPGGTP